MSTIESFQASLTGRLLTDSIPPALRNEADLENNKTSGWLQGTEIAVDQLVAHVESMKQTAAFA